MALTMCKKAGFVLLVLTTLAVPVSPVSAHPGTTWVYEDNGGGYFEFTGGDNWTEVTANSSFRFREVARTASYVQLHDASRKISVRIYSKSLYIHYPGSGGWQFRYNGYWR